MAISGLQVIAVGLQNESANSDSLYTAFNKTKDNFSTLFACASPYSTITGNTGILVNANTTTGILDITNIGVTNVGFTSNSLVITGSPITTTGNISVDLPSNVTVSGQLILSGSENLTSGAAANISVTASHFSTTGPSTANLSTGVTGQIKTFMMVTNGGNMVITVTNHGWVGSGTMTFNSTGSACTLQYIASKWFCIGNNGVIFA
jgi:hypothetical protein